MTRQNAVKFFIIIQVSVLFPSTAQIRCLHIRNNDGTIASENNIWNNFHLQRYLQMKLSNAESALPTYSQP